MPKTASISSGFFKHGVFTVKLKHPVISNYFNVYALLVVPIINILWPSFFGIFFIKIRIAYKMGFENLGPMSINSIILSILSKTTHDNGEV